MLGQSKQLRNNTYVHSNSVFLDTKDSISISSLQKLNKPTGLVRPETVCIKFL